MQFSTRYLRCLQIKATVFRNRFVEYINWRFFDTLGACYCYVRSEWLSYALLVVDTAGVWFLLIVSLFCDIQ